MSDLEEFAEPFERGMAIVAHPDDMEYGAASAVACWVDQGRPFTYVLATRGEAGLAIPPAEAGPLREAEQRASAAVVGVDDVRFLGHPDGMVEYSLTLRRDLTREIRRDRPGVIVTLNRRDTWGGPSVNMADHRNVGLAVLDAVRDAANPWTFPELVDEGFEPWDGVTAVLLSGSPVATHFVDVTGYLDRGIASLAAHAAYVAHVGTDPDEWLTSAATSVGADVGVTHAVSFEVARP